MEPTLLMSIISLVLFAGVVFVALKTNINPGILGVAVSLIFGFFVMAQTANGGYAAMSSAALNGKPLLGAFPTSMVWTILTVSFFVNIGVDNGTWDLFVRKFINLARGNRIAIPLILALTMTLLNIIGVVNLGTLLLMYTIAVETAKKLNMDPIMTVAITHTGSVIGSVSPIAFSGIIANNLANEIIGRPLGAECFTKVALCGVIAIIAIMTIFKAWKSGTKSELIQAEKFNRKQILTLLSIVVFLGFILGLKTEVGASAFCVAVLLLILLKEDGKKAFSLIPWNTIVLVAGMVMFVSVVKAAGGITLLTDLLSKLMNKVTAKPIMVLIGALMSMVSSATGVVLPTMFPVAPGLAEAAGVAPSSLMISVLCGAFITALSPMSTVGGVALSIMSQNGYDQNTMFKRLFVWAFILTGLFMVCSLFII